MPAAQPQQFAQLSDPHLSTLDDARFGQLLNKRALGYLSWRRKRQFEHRREVLEALQQDLDLTSLDQLLITGDLTHIGLPQEFDQCSQWLGQLGSADTIALVPGNHDACVADEWEDTFAKWAPYMAGDNTSNDFPTMRKRGQIAFIGLSTGCPKPPLMATGTLGSEQLDKLPALLEQAKEQDLFRVVYLHHCPVEGLEKWRKRLTDARSMQTLLEAHGAELVIHGHGHRAHYSELDTRDGKLPVIAVPSASALGLHGADVACYNHYAVTKNAKGWQLDIQVRRYDIADNAFTAAEVIEVHLAR
ncbi:MAG: metallophosphoesterase [Halioglobus sp.]